MPTTLSAAYRDRLAGGSLVPDRGQAAGVDALDRLLEALTNRKPGLFRKPAPTPRGIYLWGPVGRGKSMLMDLFFDAAPTTLKRRVHFHVFMAEVHQRMNLWRSGGDAERRAEFGSARGDDPIPHLADLIVRSSTLLCFDELQVTDIADAMILGRLFEALFARGDDPGRPPPTVAPDELYQATASTASSSCPSSPC